MRRSTARTQRILATLTAALLAVGLASIPVAADPGQPRTDPVPQLRHDATEKLAIADAPDDLLGGSSTAENCGPITQDVVMTEDLLACWNGEIAGSGITVDLDGLTIPWTLITGNDVVLRNGTVDGSLPGPNTSIYVFGSDVLLDRLTVRDGGPGFVVETGDGTIIRNSLFQDNLGIAVDQYFGSFLTVENSTFVDNGIGVSIQAGQDAVVEKSRFEGNGVGVNVWDEDGFGADGTTVRSNRFVDNRIGIRVRGIADASRTLIEDNTIRGSASSGILVTSMYGPEEWPGWRSPGGANDTTIRNNVIQRSGDEPEVVTLCAAWPPETPCATGTAEDGVTIIARDPVVLPTMVVARNKTMHNQGYGIDAAGVTDGGKNVAVRNGAGSCVGVRCTPR